MFVYLHRAFVKDMAVCGEELSKNLGDISHVFKKKKRLNN